MRFHIPRIILLEQRLPPAEQEGKRAAASTCLRRFAGQNCSTAKEAGKRNKTITEIMKHNQQKISVQDLLESEAAQRLASSPTKESPLLTEAVQEEMAEREMKRIFDGILDRTSAILRELGVELTHANTSWHPLNDFDGLGERLSHVEIVPELVLSPSTGDE